MPDQFAESWEYYTPDPEVAELLAETAAVVIDRNDVMYGGDRALMGRAKQQAGTGDRAAGRRCVVCDGWFHPHHNASKGLYCSRLCAGSVRRVAEFTTGCPGCGRPVPPGRKNCSDACRVRVKGRRMRARKAARRAAP